MRSTLEKAYLAVGIATIAVYAVSGMLGIELGSPQREFIPADVRQSPGGYRSFHFWHAGYRGGK